MYHRHQHFIRATLKRSQKVSDSFFLSRKRGENVTPSISLSFVKSCQYRFHSNSPDLASNAGNTNQVNHEPGKIDSIEKEEEYLLQHIPSATNEVFPTTINNETSSFSPFQKIVEAWADVATQFTPPPKNSKYNENKVRTNQDSINKGGEDALQQTFAWFGQLSHQSQLTPHQKIYGLDNTSNKSITTSTYNSVLKVLGKMTNNSISILAKDENEKKDEESVTVEQLATQILEQMKSSDTAHFQPNIDTYNTYITCIRRYSPRETAIFAESILKDLHVKAQTASSTLMPNVETYNEVLKWFAMDYLHTSTNNENTNNENQNIDMSEMEELYQQMIQNNIVPNYRTYQIILNGLTLKTCNAPNYQFDPFITSSSNLETEMQTHNTNPTTPEPNPNQAQFWIERMKETLGSKSVDSDIWNLTLPFFPSKCYPDSIMTNMRPYSPYAKWKNEWDEKKILFPKYFGKKKFLNFKASTNPNDPNTVKLIEMAHRLEVWVQYIADNSTNSNETFSHQQPQPTQEESNISFGKTTQTPFMDDETHEIKSETRNYPTIEAINAVVLAWIQTGTKEGFLRAESWALKALDFPHLKKEGVHVNTFLPIIMAWTSCGEQYGVERIKEWVEKLNELSILFEKENQSQGETATNNHDLRVNAHILHALISAWFRHQQVLYDTNGAENTAEIIHAAHQSTYWLEKLCELEKHPNMFVEPLNGWVFVHVIETWAKAYKIQHFNAKADAERSGNEWDSSTFFPAKEICSAKIFHVVKLMNSKITLKDDNQPQMFDLLHTFHLVYIHALQSLPRTKKAGQSLQINSQFIDIQQMLYISDILYPHLMETFNDGLSHDVTFSDMDTISFLVIPHMYLRLLKVANNNKDHPYTLFYMKILQLSKSFQTVSQGLRLKTVHGIIDRLSLSNTSIINSRSDKSEIWKWMINSLDTIPTFKDRKEIMEIVVENGIVTAENPDMLLELVGKVMRNPSYARANRRPSKDVLDNWLNQLKKHAKKSV